MINKTFFSAIVPAPFGYVGIRTEAGVLCELVYLPHTDRVKPPDDSFTEIVVQQVTCYLKDPDYQFNLSLAKVGTPFQRKVWNEIASIPSGEVLTYGEVATRIQSAPRAVGQACGANWFPLVIPCHRVIGRNGLGGFARHGSADCFYVGVKRWLLEHEGIKGY